MKKKKILLAEDDRNLGNDLFDCMREGDHETRVAIGSEVVRQRKRVVATGHDREVGNATLGQALGKRLGIGQG